VRIESRFGMQVSTIGAFERERKAASRTLPRESGVSSHLRHDNLANLIVGETADGN
jgi:hypothetical protein